MELLISNIATIQLGYQSKGKIQPDPRSDWRIVQLRDFDESGLLKPDGLTRFVPEREPERYRVRAGDVLFPFRGRNNRARAIISDLGDVVAAGYFYIVRLTDDTVMPEYLAWYMNQAPARNYFESEAKQGSHMPVIARAAFEQLSVEIPPLGVQKLVVNLDNELRTERRLESKLTELRKRIVSAVSIRAVNSESRQGLGHG